MGEFCAGIPVFINSASAKKWLTAAYDYAERRSDDPSSRNGAIIVDAENDMISWGVNHFPGSLKVTPERLNDRDTKLRYIVHAEAAAILCAAQFGGKTGGATMYVPWATCSECAKSIIGAGIKTVIAHYELHVKTPARWQGSVFLGLDMLREAGVEFKLYAGKLDGVKHLFDGQYWTP